MFNSNEASSLLAHLKSNHDLYLHIFKGRDDIVARRWERIDDGKKNTGYTPICKNRPVPFLCPKYHDKTKRCKKCEQQNYSGVTSDQLNDHFDGRAHLGCYPLLPDSKSWFVAADFDDHDEKNPRNPLEDVKRFVEVMKKYEIPGYVLSSRSGAGYHVYTFFEAPVSASAARSAYLGMLSESGLNVHCKGAGSYDRLFPSQDKHSGAGYGNLIGMPFQGEAVRRGCTVFIDPETGQPYPVEEQIGMLESIERVSEMELALVPQFTSETKGSLPTSNNQERPTHTKSAPFKLPASLPHGMRNDYIFKLASSLQGKGLSEPSIRQVAHTENEIKGEPPLDRAEVDTIVDGVVGSYASGHGGPTLNKFALTDLGNAERFAAQHMNKVKYSHSRKQWFSWDGKRFQEDEVGSVGQLAYSTVRNIYGEAVLATSEEERKAIGKHAIASENGNRIEQMIKHAKNQAGIPIRQSQLDADNWLINCQNGVLDLKTQTLTKHDPNHLMTKVARASYDPDAYSPLWESFLKRIFGGNQSIIDYLQKIVGVALTGKTLQAIFILHGIGANGKSTFLEVIRRMLGDYAQQADINTFIEQKNSTVREDLASLCGARVVMASECDSGKYLSEALVKQITGGEAIRSRFLYGRSFEYVPTFNIFLATNHRPNVQGTDLGIWRRLKLIPFNVTIPEPERDEHLLDKLLDEMPGIFAWAVGGCAMWQADGLDEPDEVKAATQEYRADNDILTDFINDRLELGSAFKEDLKSMHLEYLNWCEESGIKKKLSKQTFNSKLRERGWEDKLSGTRHWLGVRIKPDEFANALDCTEMLPFETLN